MTAYNPPLFSFSTLKFNSLIYEVADALTSVASSIASAFSISVNKLLTFDPLISRELWTDSAVSPIYIGSIADNLYIGNAQGAGDNTYIGNSVNTNRVGNFEFLANDVRSTSPASPLFIGSTTTAPVQIAQNVDIGYYVSIGNNDCGTEIGGFRTSVGNLTFFNPLTAINLFTTTTENISLGTALGAGKFIYIGSLTNTNQIGSLYWLGQSIFPVNTASQLSIGSTLTAGLVLGNATNANQLGKFVHTGTAMSMAGALSTAVDLFISTTGLITLGGTGNIQIGGINISNQTLTAVVSIDPVNLFNNSSSLIIGSSATSVSVGSFAPNLYFGSAQILGNNVEIGTSANTNIIGRVRIVNQTLTAVDDTASVNLFNTNTGNISLGTSQVATNNIIIGSATNNNKIGNFNFIANDITSSSISTNVSFLNNLTTGALSIATGQTASGTINIGSATSQVRITPDFNFQSSSLTAAATSSVVSIFNNITSGTINIGQGLTTGNIALGHAALQSGGVFVNKPLYLGYTSLNTLGINQIGGKSGNLSPIGSYTLGGGGSTSIGTTVSIPCGVWFVQAYSRQASLVVGTFATFGMSLTGGFDAPNTCSQVTSNAANQTMSVDFTYTNTSATPANYNLIYSSGAGGFVWDSIIVFITRLS
jgi:hypothetical protein